MPRFASVNEDLILEVGGANDIVLERNGVEVDRRGAEGFGKVLQVAYEEDSGLIGTGSGTIPLDSTTPQNTEGNEILTCSITPKSSSSYLLITISTFVGEVANLGDWATVAVFRDSGSDAIFSKYTGGSSYAAGGYNGGVFAFTFRVLAGSTSSTTFKLRAGQDNGSINWNGFGSTNHIGASNKTSIAIMEIAQ